MAPKWFLVCYALSRCNRPEFKLNSVGATDQQDLSSWETLYELDDEEHKLNGTASD